jgi:hypothetical protein
MTSSVLIRETHKYDTWKATNHTFEMVPNTKQLDKNCTLQATFTTILNNQWIPPSVRIQNLHPYKTRKMWLIPIQQHQEHGKQRIIELSRQLNRISMQFRVIRILLHQFKSNLNQSTTIGTILKMHIERPQERLIWTGTADSTSNLTPCIIPPFNNQWPKHLNHWTMNN